MTEALSKDVADDLTRQFEAGLAKVRYELQKNLNELDPLQKGRLQSMLDVFSQRLVIFQHDFLEYIARTRGGAGAATHAFTFQAPDPEQIPEIASSLLAGATGSLLLVLIPAGTTGHLWWSASVGLGAVIAGALGWPVWLVVVLLSIGGGAGVFVGVRKALSSKRRSQIRGAVLTWFDTKVTPKLREWAQERIQA